MKQIRIEYSTKKINLEYVGKFTYYVNDVKVTYKQWLKSREDIVKDKNYFFLLRSILLQIPLKNSMGIKGDEAKILSFLDNKITFDSNIYYSFDGL